MNASGLARALPWLWRRRWAIGAALTPAAAGLLVAAAVAAGGLADATIGVAGPLREWALISGCGLAALVAAGFALRGWAARAGRRAAARHQAQLADDRRRFLLRLDHELKNPLTIIGGGIENLTADASEQIRQSSLAALRAQTDRLRRLTAGLRKLADLETQPLDLAPIDLGELLEAVVADAHERPDSAPDRPSLSLPALPLPTITGDEHLLLLAVHNLLDNALKFTPPGGRVAVRAFADDQRVLIEVHDAGPGLPPDEIPLVWDELFRGQGARGTPGSGLGLALVRAIVLRHGGQVALESQPGRGTIAKIRLPAGGVTKL